MTVKINLNRAARQVIPEGDYILNIAVAEQRKAKQTGNPNLHVEYTVDADTHPEFAGVRLYRDLSLLEQSWWSVLALIQAALGDVQAQDEEGNFEFDEEDLVGTRVAASVSVDDSYDGVPRNKVDSVYPVSEFGAEEEAGEETEE